MRPTRPSRPSTWRGTRAVVIVRVMSAEAAYFFSDAHLGSDPRPLEAERERRVHAFLNSLPGKASTLVIVGDLFDFWFEYRTAIPRRHFATLAALHRVREAGIEIVYLAGNHDFWLGEFLRDELGCRTVSDAISLDLQGRRIWVHHGDGLVGGDLGYRALKKVLRNPVSVALYRLLHPDLGIPLAGRFSRMSRKSRDLRTMDGDWLYDQIARPRFSAGFDSVLIGHFHGAFERHDDGHDFFVLGDWMRRFTYVVLESGRFRMETWPD